MRKLAMKGIALVALSAVVGAASGAAVVETIGQPPSAHANAVAVTRRVGGQLDEIKTIAEDAKLAAEEANERLRGR